MTAHSSLLEKNTYETNDKEYDDFRNKRGSQYSKVSLKKENSTAQLNSIGQ
jgi:hypothetical protein